MFFSSPDAQLRDSRSRSRSRPSEHNDTKKEQFQDETQAATLELQATLPDSAASALDGFRATGFDDAKFDATVCDMIDKRAATEKEAVLQNLTQQEQEFAKVIEQGSFEARSAVGQAFSRAAGKDPAYKELKGWQAKRDFRMKWAQARFESMMQSKMRQTVVRDKHIKKGEYIPFRKVWEKEGLDEAGFEAARNYVRYCLEAGGEWCRKNPMTKRVDFMYVTVGRDESYEEIFSLTTEQTEQSKATAQVPMASGAAQTATTSTQKAKARSRALPPSGTPEKPVKSDELSKELSKAQGEANKIRARYHEVSSGINTMITAAENDADWAWLKEAPTFFAPLHTHAKKLAETTGFARRFLDLGLKGSKGIMSSVDLLSALKDFKGSVEPSIVGAEKHLCFLRSTHSLRKDL